MGGFMQDRLKTSNSEIALVHVNGMLTDSSEIVRQLSKYRRDAKIKAIIVRIDSPGGTVGPAQEIYDEINKIKESKKIVYASLGSVAASGGYYIACAADYVLANPGTLTGSIGAIMAFNNVEELAKKIGVRPAVIKSGAFKDSGSPLRSMEPKERKLLQNVVDDVHQQFVQAVSLGRNLSEDEVKQFADGRIMTGKQALEFKLVDEFGGLEKTIEIVGKKIGVVGHPSVIEEKEDLPFMDWLMQSAVSKNLTQSLLPSPSPRLQYLWFP
ncbi:MAG: signal peptide peptidase SppA [Nitrospina sp.]|nr:signal peptide peptidase SppA [Nitrospina sp.]MBT6718274.1 signal peptide peptidase SppA [Nitrospina sp.]